MVRKPVYRSPLVLREVSLEAEVPILGGSIVDNVSDVSTVGQDVNEVIDASSNEFNHSWK